jgi:hypothetical protein
MKEIGKRAARLRRGIGAMAEFAVSMLSRAVAAMARRASLAGLVSLVFSAISLYVTVLEQPRLKILAGCNWQYGRGPGSFDEYFVVPLTFVNTGARGGTALAVELVADKGSVSKTFTARFAEASFDAAATRRLFAPIAVDGHGSQSSMIVFTERRRTYPPLFDLEAITKPERFRAALKLHSVAHVSYPVIDRLLAPPPAEARFEPLLRPEEVASVLADKRAGLDACASDP